MIITSLTDALKTLAQSLQLSTVFPSIIFVLVNVLLVFRVLWPDVTWTLENPEIVALVIVATIILSYLLYAFNYILIRLVEGYIGKNRPWFTESRSIQIELYREQMRRKFSTWLDADAREAAQSLDLHFPSREKSVLPTSLGNAIAAFEDYSYTRYGIDAVVTWPRLLPILRTNKYVEVVAQNKTVFDFLLNMMFVVIASGVELTYASIFGNRLVEALLIITLTYILVKLFYAASVGGAVQWGLTVRVAFDLYRYDLWKFFRLRKVSSYQEEKTRWAELSRFLAMGNDQHAFDAFAYDLEIPQEPAGNPKNERG